jgi:Flp pilus assembly protein TadG
MSAHIEAAESGAAVDRARREKRIDRQRRLTNDKGITIPLIALSMIVLLAFVAFAVDLGQGYAVRRQSQSSADSAALAAAQQMVLGGTRAQAADYAKLLSYDTIALQPSATGTWDGAFASCSDGEQLAVAAPSSAGTAGVWGAGASTACISFSSNNQRVRVRIPGQTFDTSFAHFVGVDTFTVSTFAEADINFTIAGGGAMPYAITPAAAANQEVCLNNGAGNVPDCTGSETGNFGAVDWSLYGNTQAAAWGVSGPTTLALPTACSDTSNELTATLRMAFNLMLGVDHPLGVVPPLGGNANAPDMTQVRNDRTICGATTPPNWLARPNQSWTQTGNAVRSGTEIGLINGAGNLSITLRGRLDRHCGLSMGWNCDTLYTNGTNARGAAGSPIDDTPLWEFLSTDLVSGAAGNSPSDGLYHSAPDECLPSAFSSSPTKQDLLACFTAYEAGGYDTVVNPDGSVGTVLFGRDTDGNSDNDQYDIMQAPRFGFVPLLWEQFPSGQSDPINVRAFRPVYLQTTYYGCSGGSCDGVHNPGEPWSAIASNKKLQALSAMAIRLPMLPEAARDMAPAGPLDTTVRLVR